MYSIGKQQVNVPYVHLKETPVQYRETVDKLTVEPGNNDKFKETDEERRETHDVAIHDVQ